MAFAGSVTIFPILRSVGTLADAMNKEQEKEI